MTEYDELLKFIESGLDWELHDKMCGGCEADSCDDSDCPGICPGYEIQLDISNQICSETLKFMKKLIQKLEVAPDEQDV